MKAIGRILRFTEESVKWIVIALIALMVVNISVGVFFRYVLDNSLAWVEELGRYLMVWCAMLGAGLALSEDRHVGVSMFVEAFPPKAQLFFKVLVRVVNGIFLAVVIGTAYEHLKTLNIQRSSAMEIPMVIPYAAVPVGALLMFIENLALGAKLFVKSEIE